MVSLLVGSGAYPRLVPDPGRLTRPRAPYGGGVDAEAWDARYAAAQRVTRAVASPDGHGAAGTAYDVLVVADRARADHA